MAVGNGLARYLAYIDPDVEAFNQLVFSDDVLTQLSDEPFDGNCFGFCEIKKGWGVLPWKD
jgi:hypothetical protein